MIRHIHHPSCPAGTTAGVPCICPSAKRTRRRPLSAAGEAVAFAALLASIVALPIYLMWKV